MDTGVLHFAQETPPSPRSALSPLPSAEGAVPDAGGTVRRSVALEGDLVGWDPAGVRLRLAAALLLVARKYAGRDACELTVGASGARLVCEMPPGRTLAEHERAVVGELRRVEGESGEESGGLRYGLAGTGTGTLAGTEAGAGAGLTVSSEPARPGDPDRPQGHALTVHADCPDGGSAERLLGHLRRVLRQFADRPDQPIGRTGLLDEAERALILDGFNDTARPYPRDSSVPELFAEQAATAPDRDAVRFGEDTLTYGELDARAERLAAALHESGVRRHDRVALMLDRTPDLVVAALAVLRLGAAYVPVEPDCPRARLEFLLDDCSARLLVTGGGRASDGRAPDGAGQVGTFDLVRDLAPGADAAGPCPSAVRPTVAVSAEDTAYVMYTSGTTGRPKGVLVDHRAIVRLVRNTDYVSLSPATRILQTGAVAFDATTFELWGSLLNGGALVMVPQNTVLSAPDLGRAIAAHGVTTMFLTSTLFNRLAEQDASVFSGCEVLVGGEAVPPQPVAKVLAEARNVTVANAYGPTENTTFSVSQRIDRADADRLPIGRPIANSTAYVLDHDGDLTPVGVPGVLYVGGDGLASGYLNRPDLDAASFVPNPYGPGRLYRTGDIARWTADGRLHFLGRTDSQVKIRGYRVEPGEVEQRVLDLPAVREAAVVVRVRPSGDKALVCYFTVSGTGAGNGTGGADAALRTALKDELPEYMVPSSFVELDAMPVNGNGKTDRKALADRDEDDVAPAPTHNEHRALAPRTPRERLLAGIFAQLLGLETVGTEDNFFELGGHSLLAMQLWNWIRSELDVEVELRHVLETPTVAGLAGLMEQLPAASGTRPRLTRR